MTNFKSTQVCALTSTPYFTDKVSYCYSPSRVLAQSATRKLKEFEESLEKSTEQLATLQAPTETAPNGLTEQYFAEQWSRQKIAQSELFADGRTKSLEALVARLIDLEENIKEAQ